MLYGKSGCGKTTLLRLAKEETAPKGECRGEVNRKFNSAGYVFQNPEMQIVTDKVWHELAFACENLGWDRRRIQRRVGETAEYFGLAPIFRSDTAVLSGGWKQLLNLAAAAVTGPELLLLDEPASQLDPIASENIIEAVLKLNRDFGTTVVISEHNTEKIFPFAHRVVYMEDGEIKENCQPRELGTRLRGSSMFGGLPCSSRIGAALRSDEPLPLTAGEGKKLVEEYSNEKRSLLTDEKPVSQPVMELKNLSFRYEKNGPEILRSVSLKAFKGRVLSVLGGNGCGKSTLLSVMSGLCRPSGGKISYLGRRLGSYGAALYRGNIALLPQNPQYCFTHDSLKEDWASMAELTGFDRQEQLAGRLGLSGLMDSHPYDLSGGEQQRAALGKVLMQRPRLLLLDEPAKGLDAANKAEIMEIIRELAGEGTAVVIVTHDTEMAAEISDECALLFDGCLECTARPEEFFGGNIFYTTPAARISRGRFDNAVTARQVIRLCEINGLKSRGGEAERP